MRSERTFTEEARRTQIVAAAVAVIARDGFGAASLAAIARHLGVSKGVLLYHFAGKDELLRELVAAVLAGAGEHMRERVLAEDTALGRLRAYVGANLEYLDGHRAEVRALAEVLNAMPPQPAGATAYGARGGDAVSALAQLLEAGQLSGEFAPFAAPVAARSLRASIDAVTELLRTDPDVDLAGYADALLVLFERAVRA